MILPGNLNSQGAPGEEDEVLTGQRVRALRTLEGFFIAPSQKCHTFGTTEGEVPMGIRRKLGYSYVGEEDSSNRETTLIPTYLSAIADRVNGTRIEWADDLRKIYGPEWLTRYCDKLDPTLSFRLNRISQEIGS